MIKNDILKKLNNSYIGVLILSQNNFSATIKEYEFLDYLVDGLLVKNNLSDEENNDSKEIFVTTNFGELFFIANIQTNELEIKQLENELDEVLTIFKKKTSTEKKKILFIHNKSCKIFKEINKIYKKHKHFTFVSIDDLSGVNNHEHGSQEKTP